MMRFGTSISLAAALATLAPPRRVGATDEPVRGIKLFHSSIVPHLSVTQPEHRLAFGVLEDALAILVRGPSGSRGRRIFVETQDWVASDDTSWLFSFVNICEMLEVDAARLRTRIASRIGIPTAPRASTAWPVAVRGTTP